jgi:hypothetical protein
VHTCHPPIFFFSKLQAYVLPYLQGRFFYPHIFRCCYITVQFLWNFFISKEAVSAERRYEKETSTCMQVAFRARTYLLSPLPLPPPQHPPLTDAIREAGWLCFLPPPFFPRTPYAEFVWFSTSSAKSEDGLYLGAQKCCSWIRTAFVIMYKFELKW